MDKFNYGKYFYEHKIFDIEDLSELDKMSQAIEDAKKIENYFFKIVPNIDKIKNIIAFSFKLNPYLNYIDRINYIRGIAYSQDYIDYDDVVSFYNLMTDSYAIDVPTIFKEKAFCEEKDSDFFDELMVVDKLYGNNIFNDFIYNIEDENIENENEEDEEEFDTNNKDCNVGIKHEDGENDSADIEDNIIDVTPIQKINGFKKNFNRYVDMVLECKNIDEDKNSKAYTLVILGMTDWFNFVMDELETINNIVEEEKKCLRNKLSDFV